MLDSNDDGAVTRSEFMRFTERGAHQLGPSDPGSLGPDL